MKIQLIVMKGRSLQSFCTFNSLGLTNRVCLLVLLNVICLCPLLAQSVSNIVLSKAGDKIAYLRGNDELVISDLSGKSEEMVVDSGLKENANQRFLKWSQDSQFLIYENNGGLKIYNLKERSSKVIQNETLSSLSFFRWYLTRQTDISSRNELYFAAGPNGGAGPFQLFRLNVLDSDVKQLTNSKRDVSNVSISPSGKYVAFSTYEYLDNEPQSRLHILDARDERVVFESELYRNVFFSEFKWSPSGDKLLARVVGSNAKVFNFTSNRLNELALPLAPDERPVDFYDESRILFSKSFNKDAIKIGVININDRNKLLLTDENSNYLGLSTERDKKEVLFITESGIQPKTIWKSDISAAKTFQKTKVKDFANKNPLANYSYTTRWYKNAGNGLSSAYIYAPSGYEKSIKKHPLLIVPYGAYSDKFPNLGYFLYKGLFRYIDKGFIIVFPNTRGISSEKQVENYGKMQLDDTINLINEIVPVFKIDNKKIFVLGHSHGATMVFYYMTHSDIFAGGIAVNGAADWIKQAERKSMSGLPFGMGGPPEELKEKYREYSPLENIDKLNGPLLLFAGKKDNQIPSDMNSETFSLKASEKGKAVKLVLFEDEGHLVENELNNNKLWNEIDIFLGKLQ